MEVSSPSETIDKLQIAGMHAQAALQMMAIGCNAFSIHLPVMACREIIKTVAKRRGVDLALDLTSLIRPERLAEWSSAAVKAYNFFKHADRDPDGTMPAADLARIEQLNDMEMVANVFHLQELGYNLPHCYQGFWGTIAIVYPDILNWEVIFGANPQLRNSYQRVRQASRDTVMFALRSALIEAGQLPTGQ